MNVSNRELDSNLEIILRFAQRLDLGGLNGDVCRMIAERRLVEARDLCETALGRFASQPDSGPLLIASPSRKDLVCRNIIRLEHMLDDLQ